MDFSSLIKQAAANQESTKRMYDQLKQEHKEKEARRKLKEQRQKELVQKRIEAERMKLVKPPPMVAPCTTASPLQSTSSTHKKSTQSSAPPAKPSSFYSKHAPSAGKDGGKSTTKATAKSKSVVSGDTANLKQHQTAVASCTENPLPQKRLDFKELMKIASEKKNGNRSKELVHRSLKQQKLSAPPPHPAVASSVKKSPEVCTNKQSKGSAGGKGHQPAQGLHVKSHSQSAQTGMKRPHPDPAGSKSTSANKKSLIAVQKGTNGTSMAGKKASSSKVKASERSANSPVNGSKKPQVCPKPRAPTTQQFYKSSLSNNFNLSAGYSDIRKAVKKMNPNASSGGGRQNGYHLSGSWIRELGLSHPDQLEMEYEDEEDEEDEYLSDFIASDGEGDEEAEDYSAAIKNIFGYDRSRFASDDGEVMESSYAQQQFEEKRSARIGRKEDEEELRKEMEEMKRKKKRK